MGIGAENLGLPTKIEASARGKAFLSYQLQKYGRLTWPLTFDQLSWISIGIIYSSRTILPTKFWSFWGKTFWSYILLYKARAKIKLIQHHLAICGSWILHFRIFGYMISYRTFWSTRAHPSIALVIFSNNISKNNCKSYPPQNTDLLNAVNWPFAKGPTWHLLADFCIMTSQSNGPSNGCAIVNVTVEWRQKDHMEQHMALNLSKGQLICTKQFLIWSHQKTILIMLKKLIISCDYIIIYLGK